jgi:cytochrome c oxidase assembly factor CtaG
MLSALLLFSANAWDPLSDLTAAPWGMTALTDQQLVGALMWVAGGCCF